MDRVEIPEEMQAVARKYAAKAAKTALAYNLPARDALAHVYMTGFIHAFEAMQPGYREHNGNG